MDRFTYADVARGCRLSIQMEHDPQLDPQTQVNEPESGQSITEEGVACSKNIAGQPTLPPHIDPPLSPPPTPGPVRSWTTSTEPLLFEDAETSTTAVKMDTTLCNPGDFMPRPRPNPSEAFLAVLINLKALLLEIGPARYFNRDGPLDSNSCYFKRDAQLGSASVSSIDQHTPTLPTVNHTATFEETMPGVTEVHGFEADDSSELVQASTNPVEAQPTGLEHMLCDQASVMTEPVELVSLSGKGKGKEIVTEQNSSETEISIKATEDSSETENLIKATEDLTVTSTLNSSPGDQKKRKETKLKEAMFRTLDQGDSPYVFCYGSPHVLLSRELTNVTVTSLWENNVGWDVLIRCRGHTWRVHRGILCEQSPEWMAKYIPPKLPNKAPVTWILNSHEPGMLANVLQFMYLQRFEHGELDPEFPYETGCIVTNVAMYIAGTSVRCRNMMDMAIDNLEEAAEIIEKTAPNLAHIDVESFQEPLRRALLIMYEQPDQWIMRGLRLAMARLVGAFYGFIVLNPMWIPRFATDWNGVHRFIMEDNMYFGQGGCLRPVPQLHGQLLRALVIQSYNCARAAPQPPVTTASSTDTSGRARLFSVSTRTPQKSLPLTDNLNTPSISAEADDEASSSQPSTI